MDKVEARREVKRIKNLPTLPVIVQKIIKMVEDPDTSSSDVAALIAQDQVLSAKVLRMANSAFFGMSRKISSINQAAVILGFDVIKGLVLSTAVSGLIKKSMDGLWEHSIGCAAASGVIARLLSRNDAEELFVAGLLHDLGKVVMALQLPETVRKTIHAAHVKRTSFYEAEKALLPFNHGDVGLWLAEHWNLPDVLAEPMRFHHQPPKAEKAVVQTAVIHFADIMIRARGFGFGGDPYVPPLSRAAWESLNLKTSDFKALWKELESRLSGIQDSAI